MNPIVLLVLFKCSKEIFCINFVIVAHLNYGAPSSMGNSPCTCKSVHDFPRHIVFCRVWFCVALNSGVASGENSVVKGLTVQRKQDDVVIPFQHLVCLTSNFRNLEGLDCWSLLQDFFRWASCEIFPTLGKAICHQLLVFQCIPKKLFIALRKVCCNGKMNIIDFCNGARLLNNRSLIVLAITSTVQLWMKRGP